MSLGIPYRSASRVSSKKALKWLFINGWVKNQATLTKMLLIQLHLIHITCIVSL